MNELEGHLYLSLATFRKSGVAVETPVWFAESDGKLYVFSAGDAGKIKRLRNSPRARVAACDVRGKLRGDWIDATATITRDSNTIEAAYVSFREKYGLQIRLADLFSKLSGRYDKREMIEISL
ncbi:MAG: PPOX class F420-dependent oxidoreductase [bacterium]|nr:PPOX class F420-dependent oxidoreductase [bacterium]